MGNSVLQTLCRPEKHTHLATSSFAQRTDPSSPSDPIRVAKTLSLDFLTHDNLVTHPITLTRSTHSLVPENASKIQNM